MLLYPLPPLLVIAMSLGIVISSLLTEPAYTSLAFAFVAISFPVHAICFEMNVVASSSSSLAASLRARATSVLTNLALAIRLTAAAANGSTAHSPLASRGEDSSHQLE
jgi:hypothetical protein